MKTTMFQWVAALILIGTSFWRALARGYVAESYALSCVGYVILLLNDTKPHQIALNAFYIFTAIIGMRRWRVQT